MSKMALFEFMAAPAHIWLWCCSKILGWTFACGQVEEDEDED